MSKIIDRLDALMKSTQKVCAEFGFEEQYDEINTRREKYDNQPISLLVCGEFKRGKSSFINAFLGENICPEGIGITTAVITIIRYGATKRVIRSFGDIDLLDEKVNVMTEEIPYDNIEKFSKGTIQDIGDTVMLEIEIPNEKLKSGLVLIDTPGVGSVDPRHRMLTLYALPRANAILFVTAVGEEVMASEADFYKMYLAPLNCSKCILLNKIDAASDDDILKYIGDTKKKCNLPTNVKVLPVSAKLWKVYNTTQDKELFEISHADIIDSSIAEMKEEYWQQYAAHLRDDYANMIGELSRSIDTRIAELKDDSDTNEKVQSLQSRIRGLTQKKKELTIDKETGKKGIIYEKINEMIKNSQDKILSEFQRESILLSTEKLKSLVDSQSHSKTGEDEVIKQMNSEVAKLQSTIDTMINNAFSRIVEDVELTIISPSSQFISPTISKQISASHKPTSEKVLNIVQNAYSPALIGLGIGAIFSAPVLGLAAGIGGIVVAYRRAKAAERKAQMLDHIQPHVTIAMNELRMYIQKRYEQFNNNLIEQLSTSLERLNEETKIIVNMLQNCAADQKQRAEQVSLLEQKKKFLNEQMIQTQSVGADPLSINHAC